MKVTAVDAIALSVDLRDRAVTLGVGTAVKKDTVIVRVRTEDGIVGYGEAHHALAPTVVADLVNTNLAPLIIGEDALEVEHIWERMYFAQGRTHGGPHERSQHDSEHHCPRGHFRSVLRLRRASCFSREAIAR